METQHTHWKSQVNPDYLGAYAIPPNQTLILTIKSATKELVPSPNGDRKECLVIHFSEKDIKPMVCNRTNGKNIQKALKSPYLEEWIGKKIELYVSKVKAFGDTMDAIRVRDYAPVIKQIDPIEAIKKLNLCKTAEELKNAYLSLSKDEQSNAEVIKAKDLLKDKLK
jgi:hypothetical protein